MQSIRWLWAAMSNFSSPQQAYDWASRAAAQGSVPALLLLSKLTEEGETAAPDVCAAYALALRAEKTADDAALKEEAQLRMRELTLKLTASGLRAAEMLCDDCPETKDLLAAIGRSTKR